MIEQPTPTADPSGRAIRVFVSSTFRDMQAEREELTKQIFPQLRKLCEERGVTWSEVDLRWGVTEEQKAEGKVLPICLAEIRGCRPYFIGLLGERYGWVPDEIPPELVEQEPWLAEHRGRSVTELEILHGVLNDPEMADHALFYFRSPSYVDSLPEAERPDFRERAMPEDIEHYGQEEAQRRAEERTEKLRILQERIRGSGLRLREGYPEPRALGELVLEDMRGIVDRLYPEGSEPSPLDREAAEHEAFARSRARVYIGGGAYFQRLDEHAAGDGPPLVVLGESGLGKSALLANWALRLRAAHPDELVLMHFIGASPHSAEWAPMLRRVMGELARGLGIEGEIPDQPAELRAAFANWLHMAAERGRVVLVLDALNQLEDRDGAPDLVWLPPLVPDNVRLVLSTLPGRPLDALEKRGWPALEVKPLEETERERLIVEYLAQHRKTLAPERVERIAAARQSANPLYLLVLLEELRLWGEHETLDEAIERYLGAGEIAQLYELILARYEADYERDRPDLTRDAMALLWAARQGLSEAELLELLGSGGEPLPRAHWSPLYLAAEQSLVSRAGLLGFSHDYLREAVKDRYLPTEEERHAAHMRLADYFEARDPGVRRLEELPWQLAEAGSWEHLAALLGDPPFFESAWEHDQLDVKAYWARVEASSPLRLVDAYRPMLEAPGDQDAERLLNVSILFADTGHPAEALRLREHLVDHYRRNDDRANLSGALGNQAVILWTRGQLDEATALLEEQEQICRELSDRVGLQASLGTQALILYGRGERDKAMELLKEQERTCRELGDRANLQRSLGNQASILESRGQLDEAMALHKEEETICRELGDRTGIAASIGNQALILKARGQLDEAMALHKQEEAICRELGDRAGLQRCLGNQAPIFYARGELDEAMALQMEEERICRELGDQAGLQAALGNRAAILVSRREHDEAMPLLEEQEAICRKLGDQASLQVSLGNRALILKARGDRDGAMSLLKEQERICRELEDPLGLARSLGNQALVVKSQGELGQAMALHKEAETIWRQLNDPDGLATSLANQAVALTETGHAEDALPLAEEAYRLAEAHGLTGLAEQIRPILSSVSSPHPSVGAGASTAAGGTVVVPATCPGGHKRTPDEVVITGPMQLTPGMSAWTLFMEYGCDRCELQVFSLILEEPPTEVRDTEGNPKRIVTKEAPAQPSDQEVAELVQRLAGTREPAAGGGSDKVERAKRLYTEATQGASDSDLLASASELFDSFSASEREEFGAWLQGYQRADELLTAAGTAAGSRREGERLAPRAAVNAWAEAVAADAAWQEAFADVGVAFEADGSQAYVGVDEARKRLAPRGAGAGEALEDAKREFVLHPDRPRLAPELLRLFSRSDFDELGAWLEGYEHAIDLAKAAADSRQSAARQAETTGEVPTEALMEVLSAHAAACYALADIGVTLEDGNQVYVGVAAAKGLLPDDPAQFVMDLVRKGQTGP